jgi:preprotein translocase subunit SecA
MREIERYVILQVVDSRWRAHLDSMDYLRDGIHLRAMAQKDPLVEYRAEGHAMFDDLRNTIREEVVLTSSTPRSSSSRSSRCSRQRRRGTGTSSTSTRRRPAPEVIAGAGGGGGVDGRRGERRGRLGRERPSPSAADGRQRAPRPRPQRPLLVRLGQEVQEVPRRLKRRLTRGIAPGPPGGTICTTP